MKRNSTVRLTITAIFTAILILQTIVPNIGYIHIFPGLPAITPVPLTVAIYGALMGTRAGFIFGLFWGITRFIAAYTMPSDMVSLLLFQNPLISILPRVLAGITPGIIVNLFKTDNPKMQKVSYLLAGFATSFMNTAFVIVMTSLVFMGDPSHLTKYLGSVNTSQPLIMILIVALGVNGIVEMIFTGLLTPIIMPALKLVMKKV